MTVFEENRALNEKEMEERLVVLKSKPRILMLVLTSACNLHCLMCTRSGRAQKQEIPYARIQQIRGLFPFLEGIDWQGGEVFLVDYFKELFKEASAFKNIRHSIITNGLLINEEWVDILCDTGVNITFSIDAATKETYEFIRRGGSFDRLTENLALIKKANERRPDSVKLHVNTVVMRSNYRELPRLAELCGEYGVCNLRLDFLRPEVCPEQDILINPDKEAVSWLRDNILLIGDVCRNNGTGFQHALSPFLSAGSSSQAAAKADVLQPDNRLFCRLPWKKIYIDACDQMRVRPDCLCEQRIGSLTDMTIDELWNGEIMQEYRRRVVIREQQGWCSGTCLSGAVDNSQLEGKC